MWKTSSNMMSVDNGWIVDFVFQYIPKENDPDVMVEIARKNAKVVHVVFAKREAAVKWLTEAIEKYAPIEYEEVDQVGNA